MNLSPLETRIYDALEQIEVIDAHEHIPPESERLAAKVSALTLFSNYTGGDLRVSGMPEQMLADMQNPELSLEQRWRVFEPYWQHIRHGSYARSVLISAKKFYGADDINSNTYQAISEKMAAANTPGIYHRVLRDACNIRTALTQCDRTGVDRSLFTPVMPLLPNMEIWGTESWKSIESRHSAGQPITELDELVAAGRAYVARMKSEGAVGLKLFAGPYGAPDKAAAQECFGQLYRGEQDCVPVRNPLRDYVLDEVIRCAGEHELVICVHTGYWGDFRTLDPLHMIPILERHPGVRFDFYHLGYPWVRESIMLGKIFRNVWLNFCWTHIISQRFAMDALDEAIEMVPMNKVIGFGGDYALPVEKVYGHMVMAREDMARVLAARIERGLLTEDDAKAIARKWLWENPKELYRLAL